ncbi:MAG TPA: hypothetical protein VEJ63_19375 [Planctomycetota bacterium]|nr:hypothetical protein [Planctomycetota bacterium]
MALLTLFTAASAFEAEDPPIPVTVFYSAEDKHWPAAEKVIDVVAKKFPRLRVEKKSIDTDEGYKELAETEKRNLIKETGDLTLVMGPLTLTSKGKRRDVEEYFEPMVARLLDPAQGKGRLKADVPAFVKDIFGDGATAHMLPPTTNENILYFRVEKDGNTIGWVADAFKQIVCPVCNDVQVLVATSAELKTLALRPVRELERWGKPLDEKQTSDFMSGFKAKTPKDQIKVDGISGATKTNRAYEALVMEVLGDLKKKADSK